MTVRIKSLPQAISLWAKGIGTTNGALGLAFCLSLSAFAAYMVWHGFTTGCGPRPSRFGPSTFVCFSDSPTAFTLGMILCFGLAAFFFIIGTLLPIGAGVMRSQGEI